MKRTRRLEARPVGVGVGVGVLALGLGLSGCLGRAVVGHDPHPDAGTFHCAPMRVTCDAPPPPVFGPPPIDPYSMARSPDCAPTAPPGPQCASPQSALGFGPRGARDCTFSGTLEVTTDTSLESYDFTCTTLSIHLAAGTTLELKDATLSSTVLHVEGDARSSLRITGGSIDAARIELAGHAWLDAEQVATATRLVVEADSDMEGRVMHVFGSTLHQAAVRTGPRGDVDFEKSRVDVVTLDASRVSLTSVQSTTSSITASELVALDCDLEQADVHADRMTLASTSATAFRTDHCQSLHGISVSFESADLAPCAEGTELEADSRVHRSILRGNANLSNTGIVDSTLSGGDSIGLSTCLVTQSTLCATRSVVGSGGSIECVACQPEIGDVELTSVTVHAPQCHSLEAAAPPM